VALDRSGTIERELGLTVWQLLIPVAILIFVVKYYARIGKAEWAIVIAAATVWLSVTLQGRSEWNRLRSMPDSEARTIAIRTAGRLMSAANVFIMLLLLGIQLS
jgi:hypothetical protein